MHRFKNLKAIVGSGHQRLNMAVIPTFGLSEYCHGYYADEATVCVNRFTQTVAHGPLHAGYTKSTSEIITCQALAKINDTAT